MKNKKLLISILTVVLMVGVAAGSIVYVIFETPRTGQYTGNASVYTYSIPDTDVNANYGYWILPIDINTTYNVSITGQISDFGNNAVEFGLMNTTEYSALINNTSISFKYGGNIGNFNPDYNTQGVEMLYLVAINTADTSEIIAGDITVTVIA